MSAEWDDDIQAILADSEDSFAIVVNVDPWTIGENTYPCIFTSSDEVLAIGAGGAPQTILRTSAVIAVSDFPTLKNQDYLVVNGVAYQAMNVLKIQDGLMFNVTLKIPRQ